jgi:serine/threonine-protein kinase
MSADDSHLDDAVVGYLETVEAGRAPDRGAYPELAEFFADEDAVDRWTAPLREAARVLATSSGGAAQTAGAADSVEEKFNRLVAGVAGDSGQTTDLPGPAADGPRLASFGDYEVIGELGRGGMGVVYKARHKKLNRPVALKMILAGSHASAALQARFLAEARAVARFQHPHIVQLHEIGEHEGLPYFALEFVGGGSLAARLKCAPLADKEAAQLVEVLARAVHHAHERGIVHRDLKPANVLLMSDGTPKVADFGLARFLGADSGQSADGDVIGTPNYMAPEQAAGRIGAVGPLSDVYALGAILYACLTGRPPFVGGTVMETLALVRQEPPDRPRLHNPRVSRSLQAICLRCLAKDPHERYPSAEALADDLGAYLRGEPVRADGGAASRLAQALLRETRYTEVMTLWSGVWMAFAVLYFFVCLAKSLLLWNGVHHQGPYFLVWVASCIGLTGMGWFFRIRSGPPLSHVERQMCQITSFFWVGFFLTAWAYQLGDGNVAYLMPILVVEAAIVFASLATLLGGSFYVMSLACVATAVLECAWPEAGPLISGAVCSPALFWLGWKYRRRAPSA